MAVRPFPHARQQLCAPASSEGFAVPQSPALSPTASRHMLWGRSGAPVPPARREPVCQQVGCPKRATFGRACDGSGGRRAFCAEHRSAASHVDLNRKRCKHAEGCKSYAYYQGWAALAAAVDAPCPYTPNPAAPVAGGPSRFLPPTACSCCASSFLPKYRRPCLTRCARAHEILWQCTARSTRCMGQPRGAGSGAQRKAARCWQPLGPREPCHARRYAAAATASRQMWTRGTRGAAPQTAVVGPTTALRAVLPAGAFSISKNPALM